MQLLHPNSVSFFLLDIMRSLTIRMDSIRCAPEITLCTVSGVYVKGYPIHLNKSIKYMDNKKKAYSYFMFDPIVIFPKLSIQQKQNGEPLNQSRRSHVKMDSQNHIEIASSSFLSCLTFPQPAQPLEFTHLSRLFLL